MKTLSKKILTACLALAVAAVMAMPAFAESATSEAISPNSVQSLFDVPVNKKVHITSIAYPSGYLNVETPGTVQANNYVGLFHNTGDDSQRWYIEEIDKANRIYRVGCYNHTDLALNILSPSQDQPQCTVYPWQSNNPSDYQIKIVNESSNPIISNTFGFVLNPYLKCMSATGGDDGDNVVWRSPDSSRSQLWDITKD